MVTQHAGRKLALVSLVAFVLLLVTGIVDLSLVPSMILLRVYPTTYSVEYMTVLQYYVRILSQPTSSYSVYSIVMIGIVMVRKFIGIPVSLMGIIFTAGHWRDAGTAANASQARALLLFGYVLLAAAMVPLLSLETFPYRTVWLQVSVEDQARLFVFTMLPRVVNITLALLIIVPSHAAIIKINRGVA